MKQIPIHLLKERTDIGIQIKRFTNCLSAGTDERLVGAQRDDHYIFFVLEKGSASIMIDFNNLDLPESCLYYILPDTEVKLN